MTRAIILAAGQGTRLRPHTDDRPKCLVALLGRSLLERQIDALRACGVTDIHIATGYRSDQIEALGFQVSYNPRFEVTNMVESLFSATSFIEESTEEDLLICYGDIVYQRNNLETVLAAEGDIALMVDKNWKDYWALRLDNPLDDAETLKLDDNGYVIELGEKPKDYASIEGQYTGLIKVSRHKVPDVLNFYRGLDRNARYSGKDFDNMYMTSFLQAMINDGWAVKAAMVENGWLEVDTTSDLELYERMEAEGSLARFYDMKA